MFGLIEPALYMLGFIAPALYIEAGSTKGPREDLCEPDSLGATTGGSIGYGSSAMRERLLLLLLDSSGALAPVSSEWFSCHTPCKNWKISTKKMAKGSVTPMEADKMLGMVR